jgi:hypothetical protein
MQALELVARPAGFEPTTPWFVAKYSIQLSYGREAPSLTCGLCDLRQSLLETDRYADARDRVVLEVLDVVL